MGKVYNPAGQKNHVLFYTDENGRRRKKTFNENQADIKQLIGQAPLSILTADAVQGALAKFKNAGWSLQTCNHYRSAARAFTRWAALKAKRLRHDPLLGVGGYNVERWSFGRSDRRALPRADRAAKSVYDFPLAS